ncbi:septal ring lytic transglycosylase RlpA family protein [Sphingopyxis yananensis]|uniref:septal ring lytic transglycosylase RlpA family protein n=1 Tax=Sphingopyxis yananensis TaxID=2886687 RepID=UPI001D11DE91|nr:septal ring lytic transglycosylase RlpA family protein [Sphingopyxis yananensis]MCC2602470.1 septal ring lytic transglycosylase RlpA family protein [Sphingopyxis yananensis]
MRYLMAIAAPLLLANSATVQAETLPSGVSASVNAMLSAVSVVDQRLSRSNVAPQTTYVPALSINEKADDVEAPLADENDINDTDNAETHVGDGLASFYGKELAGNRTASGERFNPDELTAAHPSLAFGSKVRVTNLNNGQSVIVRINDRGPFTHRRVIDVSQAAAREIGMHRTGTARVSMALLSE